MRRAYEHAAVSAADVEHRFVAAEGQYIEQAVAGAKLSETTAQDHQHGRDGERCGGPKERAAESLRGWAARKAERDARDDQRERDQRHGLDDAGGVEAVVRALS